MAGEFHKPLVTIQSPIGSRREVLDARIACSTGKNMFKDPEYRESILMKPNAAGTDCKADLQAT